MNMDEYYLQYSLIVICDYHYYFTYSTSRFGPVTPFTIIRSSTIRGAPNWFSTQLIKLAAKQAFLLPC